MRNHFQGNKKCGLCRQVATKAGLTVVYLQLFEWFIHKESHGYSITLLVLYIYKVDGTVCTAFQGVYQ